jgi:hypothetical protein
LVQALACFSIPLTKEGRVTAIDTAAKFAGCAAKLAGSLPIQVVNDDLLAFGGATSQRSRQQSCAWEHDHSFA